MLRIIIWTKFVKASERLESTFDNMQFKTWKLFLNSLFRRVFWKKKEISTSRSAFENSLHPFTYYSPTISLRVNSIKIPWIRENLIFVEKNKAENFLFDTIETREVLCGSIFHPPQYSSCTLICQRTYNPLVQRAMI